MKRLRLWILYFTIGMPISIIGFKVFGPEHEALAYIVITGMNMVTAKMLLFSRRYRE